MPDTKPEPVSPALRPDGPIAYLTGEYPKVSHTFIQREIAALRAQGVQVVTCTVRRAKPVDVVGDDQKAEEKATFAILRQARAPHRLIGAHISEFFRSPRQWVSALGLAWRTRSPGPKAMLYQLFYFAEAGVLAKHLRDHGVVHLHNHFGNSSCSVAMLCSEMSGIPFSFTEHGPAIFFEPMRWRIDEKIARARFVVSISHFCRSQLMLFSDQAHWSKISIVHCGVHPENYGRSSDNKSGKRILFVGRLAGVKGVPLLLDAFAAIRHKHPDARLTVVGDGEDRDRLEEQAADLEISQSVNFAGYQAQDAVASFLDDADVLVLPSFAEGVPVVLMEAMASRIPVIASRVAGVPELVQDGVTGFVIPPGDLATLKDRLDDLLSNPKECQKMGQTGRDVVVRDFDVNREAAWLQQLFAGQAEPGKLRP